MTQGDNKQELQGVLVSAESVDRNGESQQYGEFVICLDDDIIDIRLGDRKDTVWMIELGRLEEALRTLKRWDRQRRERIAAS